MPTSPKFKDFAVQVRERAEQEYNYTFSEREEVGRIAYEFQFQRTNIVCASVRKVNFFIGAFYDGVYLLGLALNETLSENSDIRDGINLTRRMWNRDFHGEPYL